MKFLTLTVLIMMLMSSFPAGRVCDKDDYDVNACMNELAGSIEHDELINTDTILSIIKSKESNDEAFQKVIADLLYGLVFAYKLDHRSEKLKNKFYNAIESHSNDGNLMDHLYLVEKVSTLKAIRETEARIQAYNELLPRVRNENSDLLLRGIDSILHSSDPIEQVRADEMIAIAFQLDSKNRALFIESIIFDALKSDSNVIILALINNNIKINSKSSKTKKVVCDYYNTWEEDVLENIEDLDSYQKAQNIFINNLTGLGVSLNKTICGAKGKSLLDNIQSLTSDFDTNIELPNAPNSILINNEDFQTKSMIGPLGKKWDVNFRNSKGCDLNSLDRILRSQLRSIHKMNQPIDAINIFSAEDANCRYTYEVQRAI